MIVQVVNFKGMVKWLVTPKVIFVDPLYIDELMKRIRDTHMQKNKPAP